jgi:hypothetical protein
MDDHVRPAPVLGFPFVGLWPRGQTEPHSRLVWLHSGLSRGRLDRATARRAARVTLRRRSSPFLVESPSLG